MTEADRKRAQYADALKQQMEADKAKKDREKAEEAQREKQEAERMFREQQREASMAGLLVIFAYSLFLSSLPTVCSRCVCALCFCVVRGLRELPWVLLSVALARRRVLRCGGCGRRGARSVWQPAPSAPAATKYLSAAHEQQFPAAQQQHAVPAAGLQSDACSCWWGWGDGRRNGCRWKRVGRWRRRHGRRSGWRGHGWRGAMGGRGGDGVACGSGSGSCSGESASSA